MVADRIRRIFTLQEDEQPVMIEDGFSLSWSTRLKGFIICFVIGILLSIAATLFLWLPKGLILFAFFYTLGNLFSIGSTMFLMGPLKQLKKMFEETRIIAAVVMLVCFNFFS
ncbi:unnamed protein product [Calicophoron daubneyi]|uniref:Vesicle transport protein n=1 Tax=Calicophoron daubneyi TaxID=300641 RepID=A0AAV2T2J2_CALDB